MQNPNAGESLRKIYGNAEATQIQYILNRAIRNRQQIFLNYRAVKNILDLGRLGIAVYFPQGISRIRVLHVSITELGQDHRLVANESCTLHGIAPDDRPFVPCFLFRILELRQSASVCCGQLRLKFIPLQVNEGRRWIDHSRIQTRIGVVAEDFAPLLYDGITLEFLQPGSLSLPIDLCEHLATVREFFSICPFSPLGNGIEGKSWT